MRWDKSSRVYSRSCSGNRGHHGPGTTIFLSVPAPVESRQQNPLYSGRWILTYRRVDEIIRVRARELEPPGAPALPAEFPAPIVF